tara:strand:- start:103 stop:372 length:270 start_codon:yes stop_codon:yes gene_type:complete
MALNFKLAIHKLEIDGNVLFFREASIGQIKEVAKLESDKGANELFKMTYCSEKGDSIEVSDDEILNLPAHIATQIFTFIGEINNNQKKS